MKKGISVVLTLLVGAAIGAVAMKKMSIKKVIEQKEKADKHLALYLMMNQWVKVKQEGKSISDFLRRNGYKKIAIYGMNYVGETLYDELKNSEIVVAYGIDQNADSIFSEIDVVVPDAELEPVDVIIVTPIFFYDEIEEMLRNKTKANVLCMEDILYAI